MNFNLFVRQNYEKYDQFSNGWLSKDEFKDFLKACYRAEETERNLDEEQFDALFTEYDKEQNGIILKDDMLNIHLHLIGVGETKADEQQPKQEPATFGLQLVHRLDGSFHSDPEALNFSEDGSSAEMHRLSGKDSDEGGAKTEAE